MFDRLVNFDPLPRTPLTAKANWTALLLRLGLATIFIVHGLAKIFGKGTDWGSNWATIMWDARHEPTPQSLSFFWVQLLVAYGELLGGIALAAGLFSRVAALAMIVIQVGAIWLVTFSRGFSFEAGGWEYNFALIAMCLAVLLLGDGSLTVDRLLRARAKAATAAAPAREAVGAGAAH